MWTRSAGTWSSRPRAEAIRRVGRNRLRPRNNPSDDYGVVVDIAFKQLIKANDPLRTGTYSKTLTFTLSTTNP